jgi:hypothetical protein
MLGKKNYILSKLIHFKIIKNKLLYFSIITVLGNAVLFVYSLQGYMLIIELIIQMEYKPQLPDLFCVNAIQSLIG